MDSGNSGSMSSSGGEDQDHETSRPESLPGYLNSPTQFGSSDPIFTLHSFLITKPQPPTTHHYTF
ncbi:hypothetical protein Pyn_20586 [Prunus yedoensis var. nudiflora]|uniref:Uncharacterized protein n=1 Tax=Prunus yedoensis var. nudiflora TaxID=2094558 RepID=A0A314UV84_PRUYE|nr:hypothetical protein Pyn_20586 [Prunus yedoensis var. nudiflora]